MGGIAEFVHFDRNNNKVHKDDLKDDRAPTLQIVHYHDKGDTNILFAQWNNPQKFEAGRQKSLFPSAPSYVDLAPHDDFTTPSDLVSFEYDGEAVIFTANKIGAKGWLPRFTVAGVAPVLLLKDANVHVIKRGKDTFIDCVLKEGGDGECQIQFVFTWPTIQRQQTQYFPEGPQTQYFPEAPQTQYFPASEEPLEKPLEDDKTDTTLPYTAAADKDVGDKLGSEATTPRDAGAAASGFQWKMDTAAVSPEAWMTPFKAHITDPANLGTVTQWQTEAQASAGGADNKKTFAGKCLAFVMKQFKTTMEGADAKSAVDVRMQTHNEKLTKPPTKKEKKDAAEAAEEEKRKSKKGKGVKRTAGKQRIPAGKKPKPSAKKHKPAAADSSSSSSESEDDQRKPAGKKKKGAASGKKAASKASSYVDSSDTD